MQYENINKMKRNYLMLSCSNMLKYVEIYCFCGMFHFNTVIMCFPPYNFGDGRFSPIKIHLENFTRLWVDTVYLVC